MDRRFEVRKQELLRDCAVPPEVFSGLLERLRPFAQPFLNRLQRSEQREHACTYLSGLLSGLERKNTESIAYFFDQEREGLQNFMGVSTWDHEPWLHELTRQVGQQLGDPHAVLVFDPSGFAKKGAASVGVARQWLGRFGKVDNGQVGVYLGYVADAEHALVDVRLYLPKEWATDRARRSSCGVPTALRYQTRHELALQMLAARGPLLPHAWIAGDAEMGRPSWFRKRLQELGEQYLLAVPADSVLRHLDQPAPVWSGQGRPRQRPWQQVQVWAAALPATAWTRVEVRDGAKGPLWLELARTRVQARTQRRSVDGEELLVVTRRQESGSWHYDYYLSNAPIETPVTELCRVVKAEHRIEECLQRAKSEVGLAHYELRGWSGWYHHQVLSLVASWFLVGESLRGKASAPALTVPQVRAGLALLIAEARGSYDPARVARLVSRRLKRNEEARLYHWKRLNLLAPKRLNSSAEPEQ